MDKSVEHILLRLLTPAVLLFLASHLVAGVLDVRPEREQSARRSHAMLYLEAGSGAAKAKRPSKVQLRKSRVCEDRSCEGTRFIRALAACGAVWAPAEEPNADPPAGISCRDDIVPSLFLHARTRNPRDPPAPPTPLQA